MASIVVESVENELLRYYRHPALTNATTASNNTAVGYLALKDNTTGATNTAVGKDALLVNTTGSENVAVTVIVSNGLTTLSVSLSVSITFRVFISITLDETDEHIAAVVYSTV